MRIVICDDNNDDIEIIRNNISEYFNLHDLEQPVFSVFSSADEMVSKKEIYDMAFLDVEMRGISGINGGKKLMEWNKNLIIFIITSYNEYLDEAMDLKVFRYLPKPIETPRLFRSLAKALNVFFTIDDTISVDVSSGTVKLHTHSILMIKSEKRKTVIVTDKKEYTSDTTIKRWLNILPDNLFLETYKGIIVNVSRVSYFNKDTIYMDAEGASAYLSQRKAKQFKTLYLNYCNSVC